MGTMVEEFEDHLAADSAVYRVGVGAAIGNAASFLVSPASGLVFGQGLYV